jgi:hypothetical protein
MQRPWEVAIHTVARSSRYWQSLWWRTPGRRAEAAQEKLNVTAAGRLYP